MSSKERRTETRNKKLPWRYCRELPTDVIRQGMVDLNLGGGSSVKLPSKDSLLQTSKIINNNK